MNYTLCWGYVLFISLSPRALARHTFLQFLDKPWLVRIQMCMAFTIAYFLHFEAKLKIILCFKIAI